MNETNAPIWCEDCGEEYLYPLHDRCPSCGSESASVPGTSEYASRRFFQDYGPLSLGSLGADVANGDLRILSQHADRPTYVFSEHLFDVMEHLADNAPPSTHPTPSPESTSQDALSAYT